MMRSGVAEGIGGIVVFIALWEGLVSGGLLQYEYLPAPTAIAAGLVKMAHAGTAGAEILHTVSVALTGWLIAVVTGVSLGVVLGLSARARRYMLATIEVLRPLPGIAFVPLALLLFGFSVQMELVVIVLPATWPALLNTMGGVAAVPQRLHDVARSYRLGRLDAIVKIFLPASARMILVGCRLSMTLALILTIGAEMIGNPAGLGYAVVREQQSMHPDQMFGYVFIIGVIAILLNSSLIVIGNLVLPGEFRRPSGQ
jgi:ABC-type nitrate/sulfonate/bicarbonate transport system permease component